MPDHILRSAVYFDEECVCVCVCVCVRACVRAHRQNHKQEEVLISPDTLSYYWIKYILFSVCQFCTGAMISLTLNYSSLSTFMQEMCEKI